MTDVYFLPFFFFFLFSSSSSSSSSKNRYYQLSSGGGPLAYVFFVAFNTIAVTMALNLMTAFYINAFQIATSLNNTKWKDNKNVIIRIRVIVIIIRRIRIIVIIIIRRIIIRIRIIVVVVIIIITRTFFSSLTLVPSHFSFFPRCFSALCTQGRYSTQLPCE
jgi:hypothetical protein